MRRTASIAALYLAERIISIGGTFLVTMAVARKFGPEIYGGFSLAQTVAVYIVYAFVTGCEATVVRELVTHPEQRLKILRAASRVMWTLTWCAAALCAAGYAVFAPAGMKLPGILFLVVVLPSPLLAYEMDFKSKRQAKVVLTIRGSTTAVMAGVKLACVLLGLPIYAIVLAFGCESALLATLFWLAHRSRPGDNTGPAPAAAKDFTATVWREVLPVALSTATVILFFRLNHLLLASMTGLAAVGQYALAINFVQLFDMVIGVTVAALYPRMVEIKADSEEAFRHALRCMARLYAFASLAFIAVATTLGPWFIETFLGSGYRQAGQVCAILSVTTLFTSSALVRSQFINANAMPRLHVKNAAAGLATILAVGAPAIHFFGAFGAALGLIAGCLVSGLLMSFVLPETRQVGRLQLEGLCVWRGVRLMKGKNGTQLQLPIPKIPRWQRSR